MTRAKPAVVVAVHDGFYGCGTGAGASNHAFLRVACGLLDPDVRMIVMPVELKPDSPEYDPHWHAASLEIVTRAGGEVIPVSNGTAGATRFGGLDCFRQASASAAKAITAAISQAPRSLVVAFDAPFFGLAPLLQDRNAQDTVIVARATAAMHAPGDHERVTWERDGLSALAVSGGHVAATSRHIRKHLSSAYAIPDESIIDLINGLTPEEAPSRSARDCCELLPPGAGRGFLLSYGRAEPYKGFDDLLHALPIVNRTGIRVPHLVLGAVTDEARGEGTGPGITGYQRHLAVRIERENLDVTLRTRFDPRFRDLLGHPALAAVIVPSRQEPFGRIPLEAYQAARPGRSHLGRRPGRDRRRRAHRVHGRTGQPGVAGGRDLPRAHRQPRSAAAATRPRPERHRRALRLPRQHPVVLRSQGTVGLAGRSVRVARR